MSIKKYTNGSWTPACRKYGTETDTITTLPTTVIGDGTPISSYTIKGNMEQSGTPTPSSPIYPSECGERTGNLINIVQPVNMSQSGYIYNGDFFFWGENLTINSTFPSSVAIVGTDGTEILNSTIYPNTPYTVQTPNGVKSLRIYAMTAVSGYFMLNSGSTALPYEPYGYKLSILSNSTVTNIYLGEVQSTRRIKKLVLTGEEEWQNYGQVPNAYRLSISGIQSIGNPAICSHFVNSPISKITSGMFTVGSTWIYIRYADVTDLADFKAYLAAQYANGTPVTVWYVLANPATGIVNEPIRKIGDYVDSVSGTGLATSGTAQEFDVGTTLKPSEVDMTYHGWHEHEDTKYST